MIVRLGSDSDEELLYHTHDPVLSANFIHQARTLMAYPTGFSVDLCEGDDREYVVSVFNEMRIDVQL